MTRFARSGPQLGSTLAVATEGIKTPIRVPVSTAPALILSSGTLEALKWLALLLMTLDHVNKHLLHASVPELFAAGRLALPLFGFVLGYNLARPGALASGGYSRTARRLAVFGSIATIPFIALGGLGWGMMALQHHVDASGRHSLRAADRGRWAGATGVGVRGVHRRRRPRLALGHQPEPVDACGAARRLATSRYRGRWPNSWRRCERAHAS